MTHVQVTVEETHHEAKASLEVDVSDAAVSFEEPLHVLLSGRRAQATDENTTSTHVDGNVSTNTQQLVHQLHGLRMNNNN